MPNTWLTLAELDRHWLDSNLAVLRENQPTLVPVIEREKERTDILVRPIEKGFYQCKRVDERGEIWIHGEETVIQEAAERNRLIQQAFDQGSWLVLVHGIGLGYSIHEMAIQLEMQRRGEPKGLICIKRDPGLVCAAFSLFDFSIPLRTGRILWAIGENIGEQLKSLCRDHHLETLDAKQISVIPEIRVNANRDNGVSGEIQQAIQLFWETHRSLRTHYFKILRSAEQYWSNSRREIRKIWTHLNTDRGGAEMMMGLIEGFRALGLEARAPMMTDRFFTRFYRVAADFFAFQPDLLLCQNHSSNYMASFAQQIPIPRAVWYVDDPMNMANIPFHPNDRIFTVSERFAPEILKRGRKVEGVLHAAAPADMLPPIQNGNWRHEISYVGSVTNNRLVLSSFPSEILESVERAISVMRASPLSVDIRRIVTNLFPKEHIAFLVKSLSTSIPKGRFMTPERLVYYFIYTEANSRRRVEAVSLLEEINNFALYGPADWLELLPSPRLKEAYRGPIDSRDDLLDLYRSSRINLSINSLQGFGFINSRVFDVPSAGGFLLTEWSPILSQIFEEAVNCVWYRAFSDMLGLIHKYLDRDEERISIILRSQERIRSAHTYRRRAMELLRVLGSPVADSFPSQ